MDYALITISLLSSLASMYGIVRIWHTKRSDAKVDVPASDNVTSKNPTVSICIPARNEAHALGYCLDRVIASSYDKLEILVLDDSSIDNTSVLIKSFAHAGVRFIPGKQLPKGWIGKNHALSTLLDEASGELVIFMDVDTKIEPATVQSVVNMVENERLDMLAVVPQRRDMPRSSALFGTMRYFWELVCTSHSQPMSSNSFWAVRKPALMSDIDFAELRAIVQPERQLARHFLRKQSYKSIVSTAKLGVYYEKRWLSQMETSQRLLFPFMRRSTATFLMPLFLLLWNLLFVLIVYGFVTATLHPLVLAAGLIAFTMYYLALTTLWSKWTLIGALMLPYIALQELMLLVLSTFKYATNRVTWKGRSVRAELQHPDYFRLDE